MYKEGKWFTYLKLNWRKCTAYADKNCTISESTWVAKFYLGHLSHTSRTPSDNITSLYSHTSPYNSCVFLSLPTWKDWKNTQTLQNVH